MAYTHTHIKRDERGYTLLEMLVSGVILMTMLNMCLGMYVSFNRLHKNSHAAIDANYSIIEIDSAFRKTVRSAARSRESFLDYHASDSLLILDNTDRDEVALLGTLNNSDAFSVARYQRNDSDWSIEYLKTFSLKDAAYHFDTSDPAVVALTISVENEGHRHTVPDVNTLLAALRQGDQP